MMTLYQTPGSCSLAPLIAFHLAGVPHDTILVDAFAKKLADGSDYYAVNPKGMIPTLKTEDGEFLTEVAVILQYLSSLAPDAKMLPADGMPRLRMLEMLNFIATEIHKGFPPPKMFFPDYPEQAWNMAAERYKQKLAYLSQKLGDQPYLMGDALTAADMYLFATLRGAYYFKFDMTAWPNLISYLERLPGQPAIAAALAEEGLQG